MFFSLRAFGMTMISVSVICAAFSARGQEFPNRPIRVIVAYPPGAATDLIARAIQPHLEKTFGQPIIIENRSGAAGMIGINAVAKAPPDGYLLGVGAAGALAVNASMQHDMPYDPIKDIAPVARLALSPFVLVAPKSSKVTNVTEAIALARTSPAAVAIGHGGTGSLMHLSAKLFSDMIGVPITFVPYKGNAPMVLDVLSGVIPFGMTDIPTAMTLIQSGEIKAFAVTMSQRLSWLPDVPTFAEVGLQGYESVGWLGVVAAAGTPEPIITKLNQAITGALEDPAIIENIRKLGAEPASSSPQQFRSFIISEINKWATVAKGMETK